MSLELFLGGLASLFLSAVIIIALTSNKRGRYPGGDGGYDVRRGPARPSKSDR